MYRTLQSPPPELARDWPDLLIIVVVDFSLQSGDSDSGLSYMGVLRFIMKKYPDLEPQQRTFLLKKSLKRQLQKGTVKQVDDSCVH